MGRIQTVKNYKIVEVSEKELEDLIRQGTHLIEDGLKYVDHQRKTDRGRSLDMLMVDSGGALVVAELKVCEDDSMLVQGIDYYDYIAKNIEGLSRAYSNFKIKPTQTPRLLLIAPSISVNLLNRCKWIDIPISIFTYNCLRFEGSDEITPVFSEINIPSIIKPVETHTIDGNLDFITDATIKSLAHKILDEIQGWDKKKILIDAIKIDISLKYLGKVFAYLYPRRKTFLIATNDIDGNWTNHKINDMDDFRNLESLLKGNIEKLKK